MISCHIPRTFLNIYELWQVHCKDTEPEIRNKYSQKRNCTASVLISTFCERVIYSHNRLTILLQENMWADPGKKNGHRHMNVEIVTESAQSLF
jgi:hypothetical protein